MQRNPEIALEFQNLSTFARVHCQLCTTDLVVNADQSDFHNRGASPIWSGSTSVIPLGSNESYTTRTNSA